MREKDLGDEQTNWGDSVMQRELGKQAKRNEKGKRKIGKFLYIKSTVFTCG